MFNQQDSTHFSLAKFADSKYLSLFDPLLAIPQNFSFFDAIDFHTVKWPIKMFN